MRLLRIFLQYITIALPGSYALNILSLSIYLSIYLSVYVPLYLSTSYSVVYGDENLVARYGKLFATASDCHLNCELEEDEAETSPKVNIVIRNYSLPISDDSLIF